MGRPIAQPDKKTGRTTHLHICCMHSHESWNLHLLLGIEIVQYVSLGDGTLANTKRAAAGVSAELQQDQHSGIVP